MSSNDAPSNPDESVSLTVREAYVVGRHRGIAKLPHDLLSMLDLANGDVVELRGCRRTYAQVHELYPADQEKGIIRLDEILRSNVGIGLGGKVKVMSARREAPPAKSVILAPMTTQTFPFAFENMLAPQLDSIPVTEGDFLAVNLIDIIIFRVVGIRLDLDRPSNTAAAADNTVATITKETKIVIQPEPISRFRQTLTYDAGGQLRYGPGPPKTNKGPLNLKIDVRGISDESIEYDYGFNTTNEQDKPEPSGMTQESVMILTMEVTVSTSKFHRHARTFSRLIPPNEDVQTIIKRCMDSAVNIVDKENAKLPSSTTPPAANDLAQDPSKLFFSTENVAKLNLLLQSVHNTVDKILSQWSAITEGANPDEQPEEAGKALGSGSLD
ncbi:MAG: hypothetical protein ABI347_00195 [Nitrososphaera sp.]|jgi:transitional endoplasmic reticulum ATPase